MPKDLGGVLLFFSLITWAGTHLGDHEADDWNDHRGDDDGNDGCADE